MTELTITPKTADKTARFRGAVAAGEHVAVTIKGGAAWLGDDNGEHLSLRVLDLVTGRTLAVFPRPPETYEDGDEPEEQDEWDTAGEDDADLFCNLNLNTDRMVNAARHMLRVPVLFVLGAKDEDNPATTRTLYFRDRYIVEFWPERVGDDTPYDLDKWPKQINEWTELIDGWTTQFSRMKIEATPTVDGMSVTVWDGTGEEPEPIEIRNGRDGEDGAPGQMTEEMTDARIALLATPIAHASDTDLHLRSGERAAWTAKYNKPQGGIPASDLAGAVQTSLGKADTALQASDITGKADKATTYTKAEVDAIVAALKTGSRQIVASLSDVTSPQPMVIYMVAKSAAQTSNVYDEFIWVDVNGVGRWEKIGDTEIDLSGYAKTADLAAKQDVIADLAAIRSGAAAGATALQDAPTATETLAAEEYSSPDNSVMVDTPSQRGVKLKIRNLLSNTVNTLDTSASGTIATREWVQGKMPSPSNDDPSMDDGTAWEGESDEFSRADHVHPTDTSRAAASDLTLLAQTVAGKADAADLRYAKVQCVVAANPLPDAFFPITFTYNGVPYTASSNADLTYYGDTSSYYVHYNLPGGGDVALAYVADGVWDIGAISDLAVNGCPVGAGLVVPLLDRAVQSLDAGAYTNSGDTTVYVVPPPAVAGRVRDCLIDVDNSSGAYSANLEFAGLGAAYLLGVADGDDLADLTTVEAGTRARFYFTETALVSNGLPVISVQRITLGAVATAITRGA